ncbi:578_t:CDS:1 [Ambispora gerdemannii]|uniref:578_t:CDS:1 n=1 Tax=Ambispora gerdemannii TaxID=144530 RepID=A0A9N9ARB4_9GLOM|nr:578_t:CDS:1 [Ambispora gerdemannii]
MKSILAFLCICIFCYSLKITTTTAIPKDDTNPSEHYSLYNSDADYGIRNFTVTGANNVSIFVEEIGDTKNPTVVFIHGFLAFRLIFNPVFKNEFLYKDLHLVRYDSRGTLDSGKPTDPNQYVMDYNAQDLKAIVDAVVNKSPGKQITLVGWSMGTAIATLYLGNFGQDKVNGLVTLCGNVERQTIAPVGVALLDPIASKDYQESIEARYALPKGLVGKNRPPISEETALFLLGGIALIPTAYVNATWTSCN